MGLRDICRRLFGGKRSSSAANPTRDQSDGLVNMSAPGIRTVSDFLKYGGNVLDIMLKDRSNYRSKLVGLSDDCKRLILMDVTEYVIGKKGKEKLVAKHERVLILIADIDLVEVKTRDIVT